VLPALARRANAPGDHRDLAGAIVTNNQRVQPLGRIADLLIGALLAAHRVPAAAGAWLLMLTADHPETQESARAEAKSANDAPPDECTVARRTALESLRLYPATWMIARILEKDVDLGSWRFRRGHNILISPYVIHRDNDLFPEASQFLPERWQAARLDQAAFLTFGSGIHLCPGRSLAVSMLTTTLTTIATRYRIDRAPGTVVADPRTTLLPVGLKIRLTPHNRAGDADSLLEAGEALGQARFCAAASP
jgi:unspecific monooxygenase